MKRGIALLLAVILCLSLAACGGKVPEDAPDTETEAVKSTKDEMLAIAVECSAEEIEKLSLTDIDRAKRRYCGKTMLLSGQVISIQEDHIELGCDHGCNYLIDVYLDADEIADLLPDQPITVIGRTTDELSDDSRRQHGRTIERGHYQMTEAYFVGISGKHVKCTGVLKGSHEGRFAPAFSISIKGGKYLRLVYFSDEVDTSKLRYNQKVTISARAAHGATGLVYYEAKILD